MTFQDYFEKFGGSFRSKHCKKRSVDLPKSSGLPKEFVRLDPWEGEYLWTVAQKVKWDVLEIGRCNGGSTFMLACAVPNATRIVSIDKAPVNDVALRSILDRHGLFYNVDLVKADSRTAAISLYPKCIDLLFIDGDHSYEGCKADLSNWSHLVVSGGNIILHDSYAGSYGVQRAAIEFVAAHPEFKVIKSPLIPSEHWTLPSGSLAHLWRC